MLRIYLWCSVHLIYVNLFKCKWATGVNDLHETITPMINMQPHQIRGKIEWSSSRWEFFQNGYRRARSELLNIASTLSTGRITVALSDRPSADCTRLWQSLICRTQPSHKCHYSDRFRDASPSKIIQMSKSRTSPFMHSAYGPNPYCHSPPPFHQTYQHQDQPHPLATNLS